MPHMDRAHFLNVDARPHDMTMLAGDAAHVRLDMEHDGAGLARKAKALFDGGDRLEILLAGQR